jgi:hypothetical protein
MGKIRIDELCNDHRRNPEPGNYCGTCRRIRIEQRIVRHTAKALIAAGYTIDVNDGEETTLKGSTSLKAITEACFSTDEDRFYTYKEGKKSFVQFIYGNGGHDVISDYGMSLEPVMAGVMKYTEQFED